MVFFFAYTPLICSSLCSSKEHNSLIEKMNYTKRESTVSLCSLSTSSTFAGFFYGTAMIVPTVTTSKRHSTRTPGDALPTARGNSASANTFTTLSNVHMHTDYTRAGPGNCCASNRRLCRSCALWVHRTPRTKSSIACTSSVPLARAHCKRRRRTTTTFPVVL